MGEAIQFAPTEATNTEQAYQIIQHAIKDRREAFIEEYQAGKYGSEFQTYENELDRAVYRELGRFRTSNYDGFKRAKDELDAYTINQLQTFIGERLNVGLSTHTYVIRNGQLFGNNMDEPLVDMIDRGRQTRNTQATQLCTENKISTETAKRIIQRHDAEVEQFKIIGKAMSDPTMLPGTIMLSISPPGPGYVHNFYDAFILREHPDKTRYVEAKRYTSALDPMQSLQQASILHPGYGEDRGDVPLEAYFLAHPVLLDDPRFLDNPDGLHAYLQRDHRSMNETDFVLIKDVIAGVISIYLHELFEHPDDISGHAKILDALRNKADWATGNIEQLRHQKITASIRRDNMPIDRGRNDMASAYAASVADIGHFGVLPVRVAITGCGKDGSSRKQRGLAALVASPVGDLMLPGNMSPFSILDDMLGEDGPDGKGPLEFDCNKCNGKHTRPLGEYLPKCPVTEEEYEKCA